MFVGTGTVPHLMRRRGHDRAYTLARGCDQRREQQATARLRHPQSFRRRQSSSRVVQVHAEGPDTDHVVVGIVVDAWVPSLLPCRVMILFRAVVGEADTR